MDSISKADQFITDGTERSLDISVHIVHQVSRSDLNPALYVQQITPSCN